MKFFIGQRVRACLVDGIQCKPGNVPVGATGTIASDLLPAGIDVTPRYVVRWDRYPEGTRHHLCVEPLDDYDGNKVTHWNRCAFRPKALA